MSEARKSKPTIDQRRALETECAITACSPALLILRDRAEINSHFAAGHQARWRGASDELSPGRYVRSEQQSQRACGPQPAGARRQGRVSASLPLLDDVRHRLRRGASHLPARRSRQNVNLFLREPLVAARFSWWTQSSQIGQVLWRAQVWSSAFRLN